jgi:ribosomal protein L29
MAILRNSDVKKMSNQEKETKLKELKLELVKGSVQANKTNAKFKEIKRAISRLLTSIKLSSDKKELKTK